LKKSLNARIHDKHGDVLADSTGASSSSPLTHLLGCGLFPLTLSAGAKKTPRTQSGSWFYIIFLNTKY